MYVGIFTKVFMMLSVIGVTLPGKKRKFIELYLYAQGIIYSHYISFLKSNLQKSHQSQSIFETLQILIFRENLNC